MSHDEIGRKLFDMVTSGRQIFNADKAYADNMARLSVNEGHGYTAEENDIIENAKANGTYMKAPNGNPTNLTEKQWAQVRTKAFKDWFGDWEKAARIEKLRRSKPIEITGKEIDHGNDIKEYKKNALEYGKKLRGEYTNKNTGDVIAINAQSLKEVLHHDYKNEEQLQSIAAIPAIIENGIYIDTVENENRSKHINVREYRYYVCGLNIGGEDYTVKAAVAVDNNGNRYYDHALTHIEKTKLLDELDRITNPSSHQAVSGKTSINVSDIKDKRLISILQTNPLSVALLGLRRLRLRFPWPCATGDPTFKKTRRSLRLRLVVFPSGTEVIYE